MARRKNKRKIIHRPIEELAIKQIYARDPTYYNTLKRQFGKKAAVKAVLQAKDIIKMVDPKHQPHLPIRKFWSVGEDQLRWLS